MKCRLLQWIEGDGDWLGVAVNRNRVYIVSAKHLEKLHGVEDARSIFRDQSMIEFQEWVFTVLKREYLRASYYLEQV